MKRFKLITVVFIGLISTSVLSQHTFETLITGSKDKLLKSGVYGFLDNYILSGIIQGDENQGESMDNIMLLNVNSCGEIESYIEFELENEGGNFYNHHLLRTTDSNFIFIHWEKVYPDTSGQFQMKVVVQKITSELQTIWEKTHWWPQGHEFAYKLDAAMTKGDSIIIIGNDRNSQPWGVFFFLLDHNGDSLNYNFVEGAEYNNRPIEVWNVHLTGDQTYPYLITAAFFILHNNILILDKNLNISQIHQFGDMGYGNICPRFSSKIYNNDVLITGWTCGSSTTPKFDMGVFSVDSNYQVSNETYFGTSSWDMPAFKTALDFTDTSRIYIAGTENYSYSYFGDYSNNMILNQCNSKLESKWTKFYGGDAYYLCDFIIATEEGGCLLAGIRIDYKQSTKRDIILIKVDQNGMIHPGNQKTIKIN